MTIEREVFLEGFLAETEEHLGAVARHLATLGGPGPGGHGSTAQPRAVREVFRSLHTIKGLSAMVGVDAIVDLAHSMEVVVRAGETAGGRLAPRAVDLLAEGVRAIEQRLRLVADRKPVPPAPRGLLEALDGIENDRDGGRPGERAPSEPRASVVLDEPMLTASEREQIAQGLAAGQALARVDVVSTPERSAAGLTITAVRERVAAVAEIVRILPRALPRDQQAPAGLGFRLYVLLEGNPDAIAAAAAVDPAQVELLSAAAPAPAAPAGPELDLPELDDAVGDTRAGRFVRVDVGRLDDVLEQLSALIVTRFRMDRAVTELAANGADVRGLQSILHETSRQLRALRAAVMHARMVSVAELLERVPLMVRGLTRTTGKAVALTIDAGDAELDKSVGERVFPAIVHLIRNAVDHGIEPPDVRRAAGKPADGSVRVSCHERNNNELELTISDDGRGVDAAALARRAGVPVPADDDALLDLLAIPGLSSRTQITTTSGRGVGVDIVQRLVRDLGGGLSVKTALGEGTTFTMRIPLSITIVEAFSFETAGQVFLVPVGTVEEIVEVNPARTTRAPQRPGVRAEVSLIERRGVAVPMVALDEVFALTRRAPALATGLHPKALVIRRGGAPCAFQVDRVIGQQEVVVRPLVDDLVRVDGVTGSTDLGDGKPVLVLDLVALADRLIDARSIDPDLGAPGSAVVIAEAALTSPAAEAAATSSVADADADEGALHIVFAVGDASYALSADQVLEMETFTGATPVPGAPPWVLGLVQVRSRVVPAIDVRVRLGLPAAARTLDTRVLVIAHAGRTVGLVVDAAREMAHLDAAAAEPLHPLDPSAHVRGVVRAEPRRYLLVNLASLLGQE